eukprot:352470-Chlamydomonas_euryale.AAC.2
MEWLSSHQVWTVRAAAAEALPGIASALLRSLPNEAAGVLYSRECEGVGSCAHPHGGGVVDGGDGERSAPRHVHTSHASVAALVGILMVLSSDASLWVRGAAQRAAAPLLLTLLASARSPTPVSTHPQLPYQRTPVEEATTAAAGPACSNGSQDIGCAGDGGGRGVALQQGRLQQEQQLVVQLAQRLLRLYVDALLAPRPQPPPPHAMLRLSPPSPQPFEEGDGGPAAALAALLGRVASAVIAPPVSIGWEESRLAAAWEACLCGGGGGGGGGAGRAGLAAGRWAGGGSRGGGGDAATATSNAAAGVAAAAVGALPELAAALAARHLPAGGGGGGGSCAECAADMCAASSADGDSSHMGVPPDKQPRSCREAAEPAAACAVADASASVGGGTSERVCTRPIEVDSLGLDHAALPSQSTAGTSTARASSMEGENGHGGGDGSGGGQACPCVLLEPLVSTLQRAAPSGQPPDKNNGHRQQQQRQPQPQLPPGFRLEYLTEPLSRALLPTLAALPADGTLRAKAVLALLPWLAARPTQTATHQQQVWAHTLGPREAHSPRPGFVDPRMKGALGGGDGYSNGCDSSGVTYSDCRCWRGRHSLASVLADALELVEEGGRPFDFRDGSRGAVASQIHNSGSEDPSPAYTARAALQVVHSGGGGGGRDGDMVEGGGGSQDAASSTGGSGGGEEGPTTSLTCTSPQAAGAAGSSKGGSKGVGNSGGGAVRAAAAAALRACAEQLARDPVWTVREAAHSQLSRM